jgi:lipopolysaccharide transport system ATP-binding protein
MMDDIAIKVDGISKRYRIMKAGYQHNTLMDFLTHSFKSLYQRNGRPTADREHFWALKDVCFDIKRGENIGIIGLNGAGKSTLLKVLSRITEPTEGYARVNGRLGALLEVGTGFHWELTGRENIYLYGAILGMTKQEIDQKFDAIVDFSEIKDFIDTPVKRYSSGMYVRLAFAVAAHLEPEILMIDEVLSVGDLPFQQKCMAFAKSLKQGNGTTLFVSHNMFSIKTMCSRVIYIDQGRIRFDGPTEDGIKMYEKGCRLSNLNFSEKDPSEWPIYLTDIALSDEGGKTRSVFDHGARMRLCLKYKARQTIERPNFIIAFIRSDGVACCNYTSHMDGVAIQQLSGEGSIEVLTPPLKLVAELYTIHILVREREFQQVLCAQIGGTFHVRHHTFDMNFGVFHETAEWNWVSNDVRKFEEQPTIMGGQLL